MWLTCAFLSALLLGFYDVSKKQALRRLPVIPVLFANTLLCSLIFLVPVLLSRFGLLAPDHLLYVPQAGWEVQRYILAKSVLVLSSWVCGYYGMKYLPLTIVGPINATRPVMVLVGALLLFGERLNLWQWAGVMLAVTSFLLLSRSGKKEGIDFKHDHWIYMIVGAAPLGALSGLYDKYLMAPVSEGGRGLDRMLVQSWYNIYQCFMMLLMLVGEWWMMKGEGRSDPTAKLSSARHSPIAAHQNPLTHFHWDWAILGISLFLSTADFMYFYSLSLPSSMISIVSMIRRGSVLVSFACGALFFHEKNLSAKAVDLALVLLGMLCLYIGS